LAFLVKRRLCRKELWIKNKEVLVKLESISTKYDVALSLDEEIPDHRHAHREAETAKAHRG